MNLKLSDLAISVQTELASNAGLTAQVLEGPVPDVCLRPIRPGNRPPAARSRRMRPEQEVTA